MTDSCEYIPNVNMLLGKRCPSSDTLDTKEILEYFEEFEPHFEAEELHNDETVKPLLLRKISALNNSLWILYNQLKEGREFLRLLKFPQLRLMVKILDWFTGDVNHWDPRNAFVCAFPTEICTKTDCVEHNEMYLHINKDIVFAAFVMTSAILYTYGITDDNKERDTDAE